MDGQHFALGHYSGQVSIWNKGLEEKVRIVRSNAPVWTLSWSTASVSSPETLPSENLSDLSNDRDNSPILAVGSWNQKLCFYHILGHQVGKDRHIEYDPCTVTYVGESGKYVAVAGSNKKVELWTSEGVKIGPLTEREGWIWSVDASTKVRGGAVVQNKVEESVVACKRSLDWLHSRKSHDPQTNTLIGLNIMLAEKRKRERDVPCRPPVNLTEMRLFRYKDRSSTDS